MRMSKKILIVDDEPVSITMLKRTLEKNGYEVITASNGQEGLEAYHAQPFDLIILDAMMPGIDGLKVLETIRKEEESKGTPHDKGIHIIMLTSLKEAWMEAFCRGCDDYLVKPYDVSKLLKKIGEKLT